MKKRFLVLAMALCMVFALGFAYAEETETSGYDQGKHDTVCVNDPAYAPEVCETHTVAPTCTEVGKDCTLCNLCLKCIESKEVPATGHTWTLFEEVPAQCEVAGTKAFYGCLECATEDGEIVVFAELNEDGEYVEIEAPEVIPALEHKPVPAGEWNPADFTCGDEVSLDAVCELCDKTLLEKITIKIEHKFNEVEEVAPTCEVTGTKAHSVCELCDAILFEDVIYTVDEQDEELGKAMAIDALGHHWVFVNGTPGKCEEDATKDHAVCDREGCGKTDPENEEDWLLPAPGHEYTIFLPEVPATCTEKGLAAAWQCSVCGQLAENVKDAEGNNVAGEKIDARAEIPAAGHTWKTILGKFATCEEDGYAAHRVCTVCGRIEYNGSEYAQEIGQELVAIPAHGHVDEDGYEPNTTSSPERKADPSKLLKEADMIAAGKLPALGEDEEPESDDVAPDCDDEGYICNKWCPWCYELRVEASTVPAKGHKWELTQKGTMPDCEKTGLSDLWTCSVCGETEGNEVIAALDHKMVYVDAVLADCENDGNIAYSYCDRDNCTYGVDGTIFYVVESGAGFGKTVGTSPLTKNEDGVLENHPADVVIAAFEHGYADGYDPAEFIMPIAPVPATCYATGIEGDGEYCVLCNTIVTDPTVIPMTEHVWETVDAAEPTCTVKGNHNYKYCTNDGCGLGYIINEDGKLGESFKVTEDDKGEIVVPAVVEIAALGHDEKSGVAKAPTCTEAGWEAGTYCDRCGITLTEEKEIPALGHTEEILPAVEPTCTKEGKTEGKQCTVCEAITVAQKPVAALGHVYNDYVAEVPATCFEDGHEEGLRCSRCTPEYANGKNDAWLIYPSVIEATGHPEDTIVKVEGTDPTCAVMDDADRYYTFYYCTACDYGWLEANPEYDTAFVAPFPVTYTEDGEIIVPEEAKWEQLEHTWNEYFDRAPTCTEDGVTTARQCLVCGHKESEKYRPATGHSYEVVPGKAATCTEPGIKDGKKCSVCGDEIKGEEIPATGHKLAHVNAKPATCTEDGNEDGKVCQNPGCDYREGAAILKAPGHNTDGVNWTVVKQPTAGVDGEGLRVKYCKVCGEEAEIELIPATQLGQLGDANDDGNVDLQDVVRVMNYYLGNTTDINMTNADYNQDGSVNLLDAVSILRAYLG